VKALVAVADVDALVAKDSATDDHARTNTTSVYTAAEIFPMLPLRLSTDLTSLNEDEERLAIVVEMVVQRDGAVTDATIYRARVLNRAKLAYRTVGAWLEGRGPAPARLSADKRLAGQLRLQAAMAATLRALRHERGALSLETIEPRAVFEGEVLTDLRVEDKNRAHELIEDLMIAANAQVAKFFEARGLPALRRVLRSPDRWQRIVELAATLGERLPDAPDAAAPERFLARPRLCRARRHQGVPAAFADPPLGVVRLRGRGEYVAEPPAPPAPGHFGRAVTAYTHSTAPNRRFPDLIGQRMLKAALAGKPAP